MGDDIFKFIILKIYVILRPLGIIIAAIEGGLHGFPWNYVFLLFIKALLNKITACFFQLRKYISRHKSEEI